MGNGETGGVTGTRGKDYNIIWFTEACLSNALRLEGYIQDAERDQDAELAEFFRRAQTESCKGGRTGQATTGQPTVTTSLRPQGSGPRGRRLWQGGVRRAGRPSIRRAECAWSPWRPCIH